MLVKLGERYHLSHADKIDESNLLLYEVAAQVEWAEICQERKNC